MLQCNDVTCSELRALLPTARKVGDGSQRKITGLANHSRQVTEGVAFFALAGAKSDGANYATQAFENGAPVVVAEREVAVPEGCELLVVEDARQAMADVAVNLNRELLRKLTLVGVTGTNGKTTTTHLIRSILCKAGHAAAAVGTTGVIGPNGSVTRLENTTPDILFLMQLFKDLESEGCRHFALEVSSQGVVQRRVANLPFRVGVFTNLTPEHMETHGDFETYHQAKLAFFQEAGPAALQFGMPFVGVVCADSPYADSFVEACPGPPFLFGTSLKSDVRATEITVRVDGSRFFMASPMTNRWVDLGLAGRHNVLNALAAAAVGFGLGLTPKTIADGLASTDIVQGRLQRVPSETRQVFIDYAHTSDAMTKLLESCREMAKSSGGRLIVVFGCGGDRDKTKRPRMGKTASELADVCYVTSDNPRSEDPMMIIDGILSGMADNGRKKAIVVPDRRQAIERAIQENKKEDIIVIAGKGHEDYQIIGEKVIDFDDYEEAARVVKELDSVDQN